MKRRFFFALIAIVAVIAISCGRTNTKNTEVKADSTAVEVVDTTATSVADTTAVMQ